jgi:hypothetical protein
LVAHVKLYATIARAFMGWGSIPPYSFVIKKKYKQKKALFTKD